MTITLAGCKSASNDIYLKDTTTSVESNSNVDGIDVTVNDTDTDIDTELDGDALILDGEDTIDSSVGDDTIVEEDTMIETEPVDMNIVYQDNHVNELGDIMVVMYHGIKDNPPYHRTKENFIKDLTYMYEHNYRLISMSDYLNMSFDVPLGYTPIVFTFDDGLPSTFSLINENGQLVPDPESAVGILEAFIESHPDFGRGACFFINDNYDNTFYGEGTLQERLEWLVDHGYDIGNHTASHQRLSTLDGQAIQSEIGQLDQLVDSLIPDYNILALSYPNGSRPADGLRDLALKGIYNGIPYEYEAGFAVGPSSPLVPPDHINFTPLLAPRVRGSEGESGDLWFYFEYYESHPEKRFVSDGDKNTIVIPNAMIDKINTNYVNDLTIVTYDTIVDNAQ